MLKQFATIVALLGVLAFARADCPSDINGTGTTDIDDLLALIGAWGSCPAPPCAADIDGDDDIDVDDMLILLGAFGPCEPVMLFGCGGAEGTWARGGCGRPALDSIPNGFRDATVVVDEVFASNEVGGCVLRMGGGGPIVETYPVTGDDLSEVSDAIFDPKTGAGFPEDDKRYAGHTTLRYEFLGEVTQVIKGKAFYQITDIIATITIQVPSWTPPDDAPDSHVAEWERFSGALREHEMGHAELFQSRMQAIKTKLEDTAAGLISVPGITEPLFDDEGNANDAMWDTIIAAAGAAIEANPNFAAMDAENDAYDDPRRTTNPGGTVHGRTQGAVLNSHP